MKYTLEDIYFKIYIAAYILINAANRLKKLGVINTIILKY